MQRTNKKCFTCCLQRSIHEIIGRMVWCYHNRHSTNKSQHKIQIQNVTIKSKFRVCVFFLLLFSLFALFENTAKESEEKRTHYVFARFERVRQKMGFLSNGSEFDSFQLKSNIHHIFYMHIMYSVTRINMCVVMRCWICDYSTVLVICQKIFEFYSNA